MVWWKGFSIFHHDMPQLKIDAGALPQQLALFAQNLLDTAAHDAATQ
jgi:hypothetical protein